MFQNDCHGEFDLFNEANFETLDTFNELPNFSPNYTIIEEISKRENCPGEAEVRYFKGFDNVEKRIVFIKQIKLDTDKFHEYSCEKYCLSHLFHQNIINSIECVSFDGYGYIVEPYASGNDLMTILIDYYINLDEETLLAIVHVLLKVIAYLQSENFTHNDIKPENIVFLGDDIEKILSSKENIEQSLRLIDFASARERNSCRSKNRKTYQSPEYITADFVSISYDIWSLGQMIYYLVTGQLPLIFDNSGQMFFYKNDFLLEKEWVYFKKLREIVESMLEWDHHRRPSANELLNLYFND